MEGRELIHKAKTELKSSLVMIVYERLLNIHFSFFQADWLWYPPLFCTQCSGGQHLSPALFCSGRHRHGLVFGALPSGGSIRQTRRPAHLHDHHCAGLLTAARPAQLWVYIHVLAHTYRTLILQCKEFWNSNEQNDSLIIHIKTKHCFENWSMCIEWVKVSVPAPIQIRKGFRGHFLVPSKNEREQFPFWRKIRGLDILHNFSSSWLA